MEDRPDLDPALPRYTIRYRDPDNGWQLSKWKMTELYAAKQYAGLAWEVVPESAQIYSGDDLPIFSVNSAAKFQRGGGG